MSRGRHWSANDDTAVLALRHDGKNLDAIAHELKRTPAAVRTRLCELRARLGIRGSGRGRRKTAITPPDAIDAFLRKPLPCR